MTCSVQAHGWTDRLEQTIRLYSVSSSAGSEQRTNPRLFRHPPGQLWRSALAESIYTDFALEINSGKRFVRLEHLGLSGVIVYELPAVYSLAGSQSGETREFTSKEVFGDPYNSENPGMETEDLLEHVCAKLIFTPAYACTSFVVSVGLSRRLPVLILCQFKYIYVLRPARL